jgi:hypothetical protein
MNVKLLDAIEDMIAGWNSSGKRQIANRQPERRGTHKPRCSSCGLKIRGPNHAEGADHLRRSSARAKVA